MKWQTRQLHIRLRTVRKSEALFRTFIDAIYCRNIQQDKALKCLLADNVFH